MATPSSFLGRIIGNYVLRQPIGEGGMASVFAAEHRFLGDRVAIKLMRNTHAGNPMLKKRFFEEAKTARQIEHPNIVKVLDFGEVADDGTLYLVMELLEGRNLSALIARGPIPEANAASIAGSVANALVVVHEKGVIHRDLKPDNIFVCNTGQVKILDFGLAKALANPDETAVGTILGTPQYMAPEQAKKDMRVGPYTDIYGLGVVLFKMLTARLPFLAADRFQMMAQHVLKPPPRPSEFADVSETMDRVVLRCLEKAPAKRYPSMAALRDRLMILAAGGEDASDVDDTLVSDDDATPAGGVARTVPVQSLGARTEPVPSLAALGVAPSAGGEARTERRPMIVPPAPGAVNDTAQTELRPSLAAQAGVDPLEARTEERPVIRPGPEAGPDPDTSSRRKADVRQWMQAVETLPLPRASAEEVAEARAQVLAQVRGAESSAEPGGRPRDPDATFVRDPGRRRRRLFLFAGIAVFLVGVAVAGVAVGLQVRRAEPAAAQAVDAGEDDAAAPVAARADLGPLVEGTDGSTAVVVTIRSRPAGARVFIDEIGYGPTPVTVPVVLPKEIRLTAPGHRPMRAILDQPGDIEIRLHPSSAAARPAPLELLD